MSEKSLPNHVAIIPDGNRRWAVERGLPKFAGHAEGVERVVELSRHARRVGVHTLTIWGLSTENMTSRAGEELSYLWKLFVQYLDRFLDEGKKEGSRFVHLGRKDRLPQELTDKIFKAEEETRANDKSLFNLALDYGGQDEILRATKKALAEKISPEELTPDRLASFLDTNSQPHPYPDLVIRTSGEQRLSGLMPWQMAYAELFFEPAYFPDFTPERFDQAIAEYQTRHRRYGA